MSIQKSCVITNPPTRFSACHYTSSYMANKTHWPCNACCSTFHMQYLWYWACPTSATDVSADQHSPPLCPALVFSSLRPSSSGNFPALSSLPFYWEKLFNSLWLNFFLQVQREQNESLIQNLPSSLARCMKGHLLCKPFKCSLKYLPSTQFKVSFKRPKTNQD